MEAANEPYLQEIRQAEEKLLYFLRTMETLQEEIHLARIAEQQAQFRQTIGDLFTLLNTQLSALSPPQELKDLHATFSQAVVCCADAYQAFLLGSFPDSSEYFLLSRQVFCRGLYLLYQLRAELPILQPYWVLPTARPSLAELETRAPGLEVPVGFIHMERASHRAGYSLYVPENYTAQKNWPLIVCLHSGYGRGDDYILTWLRPAKSKGYLLLAPQSRGPTWSAIRTPFSPPNPPLDMGSIRAMLEEVFNTYAVDRSRVYLSGFSDGGIFTYILGLTYADLFTGIAPVAGRLHPALEDLMRRGQGKGLPMLMVHGGQDPIFSVGFTRQTHDLFTRLGYQVTYKELSEWGHAYPYSINESIVLPWFESIEAKPAPQDDTSP